MGVVMSFKQEDQSSLDASVIISALLLALLGLFVAGRSTKHLVSEETLDRGHSGKGPLPLVFASPLNVEEDMDCAVKRLAWEFSKKLLNRVLLVPFRFFFKTPPQGAQTSIYCAVSEEMEGVTGQYLSDCKIMKTRNSQATDDELAEKLWEASAKLTKMED